MVTVAECSLVRRQCLKHGCLGVDVDRRAVVTRQLRESVVLEEQRSAAVVEMRPAGKLHGRRAALAADVAARGQAAGEARVPAGSTGMVELCIGVALRPAEPVVNVGRGAAPGAAAAGSPAAPETIAGAEAPPLGAGSVSGPFCPHPATSAASRSQADVPWRDAAPGSKLWRDDADIAEFYRPHSSAAF
jgi:hypothetical protein